MFRHLSWAAREGLVPPNCPLCAISLQPCPPGFATFPLASLLQCQFVEVEGVVNSPNTLTEENTCTLTDNFGERQGGGRRQMAWAAGLFRALLSRFSPQGMLPESPAVLPRHPSSRALRNPSPGRPLKLQRALQAGQQPAVPAHVPALMTGRAGPPRSSFRLARWRGHAPM